MVKFIHFGNRGKKGPRPKPHDFSKRSIVVGGVKMEDPFTNYSSPPFPAATMLPAAATAASAVPPEPNALSSLQDQPAIRTFREYKLSLVAQKNQAAKNRGAPKSHAVNQTSSPPAPPTAVLVPLLTLPPPPPSSSPTPPQFTVPTLKTSTATVPQHPIHIPRDIPESNSRLPSIMKKVAATATSSSPAAANPGSTFNQNVPVISPRNQHRYRGDTQQQQQQTTSSPAEVKQSMQERHRRQAAAAAASSASEEEEEEEESCTSSESALRRRTVCQCKVLGEGSCQNCRRKKLHLATRSPSSVGSSHGAAAAQVSILMHGNAEHSSLSVSMRNDTNGGGGRGKKTFRFSRFLYNIFAMALFPTNASNPSSSSSSSQQLSGEDSTQSSSESLDATYPTPPTLSHMEDNEEAEDVNNHEENWLESGTIRAAVLSPSHSSSSSSSLSKHSQSKKSSRSSDALYTTYLARALLLSCFLIFILLANALFSWWSASPPLPPPSPHHTRTDQLL
jgi:hypothetical protein